MALQAPASSHVADRFPRRGLVSPECWLYGGRCHGLRALLPAPCPATSLLASRSSCARSALCVAVLVSGASAEMASAATPKGQVYLPVTPGDFGGMIMSLMQRQASLLAGTDGVEVRIWRLRACSPCVPGQPPARAPCAAQARAAPDALSCRAQTEGTPANVLATLANNLLGVQQAFAKEGTSAQSLQHTTGDKSAAHYDMGAPQVDPIPKVCEHCCGALPRARALDQGQGRQWASDSCMRGVQQTVSFRPCSLQPGKPCSSPSDRLRFAASPTVLESSCAAGVL